MANAVNINGQKYIILGQMKINQSVFIVAVNSSKQLINFDASKMYKEYNQAVTEDIQYISFIQNKIMEDINENTTFEDIYRKVVAISKDMHDRVINEVTLNNYFTPKYPAYDEQAVSVILANQQGSNFDIQSFVAQYMYDFTQEQIRVLLQNYNLNEAQRNALQQRVVVETESANTNGKANPGKRKTLALPAFKDKEAAFVDTVLLTFTVGTICGIYLMYLFLTIMP